MSTATFYLLRHATHGDYGRALTGRAPGVPLSEAGREEARALGRALAGRELGVILASPQLRAAETAAAVAAETGCAVETEATLDEIDFGAWSGMSFAALEGRTDWTLWNRDRNRAQTPGGETMAAVAARVIGLIDRLRAAGPRQPVALVSHADVIKAAVCHYLGLPFGRMQRFDIAPASVTTITVGDWGGTVLALSACCQPGELPA